MNQAIHIIDGGVGTELQRRGASMHPCCWSSEVHIHDPEILSAIHCDYLQAGATVISTNTFMANRHILEESGIFNVGDINKKAVELARQAREEHGNPQVLIAGCLSNLPPLNRANDVPRGRQVAINFKEQASLLAEAGVDLLLVEMILDSESASILIDACHETGLPVWAGLSAMQDDKTGALMSFRPPERLTDLADETFTSLVDTVCELPVDAVGVMHSAVDIMDPALSIVADKWPGTRLAYAKAGIASDHQWEFEPAITPELYADHAKRWVAEQQVSIVGGCCGTRPAHVEALSRRLIK